MSWGATGFTPIVTRNEPPFGFAELPNPPDYPVSDWNPYIAADYLKSRVVDLTDAGRCGDPMTVDCNELQGEGGELREGFSSGATYFLMTLVSCFASGLISSKIAYGVANRFAPLEKIPFVDRLPAKILNNLTFLKRFATKVLPISDLVFGIIMPLMVGLTIWMFNTITLQVAIYQKCKRISGATIKTSMKSALAGAIPCAIFTAVACVVLFILNRIPIFTFPLSIAAALGGITFAYITVILGTNFIFGSAAGLTSAQNNGCAAPAPSPAPTAA